jgi:hypothetical protein
VVVVCCGALFASPRHDASCRRKRSP